MMSHWRVQLRPGVALREIVQQATASLLAMDAERLEELARCCADLNRDLQQNGQIAEVAAELQRARSEMELLRRILYETRANFMVISRLQAIRVRNAGQMTGNGARVGGWSGSGREADYGDN
jgi:erythromycin esterase-like protein